LLPPIPTRVRRQGGATGRDLLRVIAMLDFLMIVYGVGFFVVAILYVLACERM
jgi:hypothetical protein